MIDIVGKLLTPLLIVFIAILSAVTLLNPLGMPQAAQEEFVTGALFIGFQEGYLTMDALAAFVFGIIVINAIKDKGAHSKKHLLLTGVKSALLAAAILAVIYSALAYIGATSVEQFGYLSNGGEALALISQHYFGVYGGVFLGIIVLLACLTTSIGLTTACSSYLHKLMPRISYRSYAVLLSIVSALLANVGLNELIQISVPVLTTIYPLAIVLMFLTFVHPLFKGKKQVYWFSLSLTFLVSLVEGLSASRLKIASIHELYIDILPLYDIGLGWISSSNQYNARADLAFEQTARSNIMKYRSSYSGRIATRILPCVRACKISANASGSCCRPISRSTSSSKLAGRKSLPIRSHKCCRFCAG